MWLAGNSKISGGERQFSWVSRGFVLAPSAGTPGHAKSRREIFCVPPGHTGPPTSISLETETLKSGGQAFSQCFHMFWVFLVGYTWISHEFCFVCFFGGEGKSCISRAKRKIKIKSGCAFWDSVYWVSPFMKLDVHINSVFMETSGKSIIMESLTENTLGIFSI